MSQDNKMRRSCPCGTWPSPISAELIAGATVSLGGVSCDEEGNIYWLEGRPAEDGRTVLVCRDRRGEIRDLTPPPFNVRSGVHEYGGGAYVADRKGIFFSNIADHGVYRIADEDILRIGPEDPGRRYADFRLSPCGSCLYAVQEEHRQDSVINRLVAFDLRVAEKAPRIIHQGRDFYAAPRPSADGGQLAFLCWDLPDMPWDAAELRLLDMQNGTPANERKIAGGRGEGTVSACFQPEWTPDGALIYADDPTGWWNLYRRDPDGTVRPLLRMEAEFGQPLWQFAMESFHPLPDGRILCRYQQDGQTHIGLIAQGRLLPCPQDRFRGAPGLPAPLPDGRWAMARTTQTRPTAIVLTPPCDADGDHRGDEEEEILARSMNAAPDEDYISRAEAIAFPTADGMQAHAYFYAPRNPGYRPAGGERPPLIVMTHGGPTSSASAGLSLPIQFWTSRGFAVADIDYRGSTGYGRAYREALYGQWGIADVEDCCAAVRHLAALGRIDPARAAIRGGSAGGYTTLAALAFTDTFRAGAVYYGIGDLEALARHTHKFESRYLDKLIGPYPEARDLYLERSPLYHADRISCPVIFFQGLEDKVVPPEQTRSMAAALKERGIETESHYFPGEGHGFRKAETLHTCLEAEFGFYRRIFAIGEAKARKDKEERQ